MKNHNKNYSYLDKMKLTHVSTIDTQPLHSLVLLISISSWVILNLHYGDKYHIEELSSVKEIVRR